MSADSVRLDRWLWAARFFKTRALASAAIAGGKVHVNGTRAKPAKQLRVADSLRLRIGPYEWLVTVRALSERRGPPNDAQLSYEESPEGRAPRQRFAEAHQIAPAPAYRGQRRPPIQRRRKL